MFVYGKLKSSIIWCFMTFSIMLLVCNKPSEPPTTYSGMSFSPVFTSSTEAIQTFLQPKRISVKAKMVFIINNNSEKSKKLCYVDFSEPVDTPVVHTIKAAKDPQLPVISPDGNWVVYASGEGCETGSPVSQRSSVYICRLDEAAQPVLVAKDSACEPRFMQNAKTMTVIYPTLAPNCAWEKKFGGKTMQVTIDVSSGTPVVGTPEVLFGSGSYAGGLSWNNRYLCGGGDQIAMLDLDSGNNHPDTVSLFAQSCNASISSSELFYTVMMHLTTNGSNPLINGGKAWKTWQTIIINDNKKPGQGLIRGYSCPDTLDNIETNPPSFQSLKWHHCEWSNHPYYAIATLNPDRFYSINNEYKHTEYQERIYLINLKDSSYLEVLRVDTLYYNGIDFDNSGFYWPGLWVEKPTGFSEDTTWLYSKD